MDAEAADPTTRVLTHYQEDVLRALWIAFDTRIGGYLNRDPVSTVLVGSLLYEDLPSPAQVRAVERALGLLDRAGLVMRGGHATWLPLVRGGADGR